MNLQAKLAELQLTLPPVTKPVASYKPAQHSGNLTYVSGQLPMSEGKLLAKGLVGRDVTLEQAQKAAARAALQGVAIIDDELAGDWARFVRIVRIGVFVASAPDFIDQHLVANGASDLLAQLLGEAGRHARAAVGVSSLPLGAAVEVELIAEVR
ncbi:MAG: RidA family protein [Phycisphaeraceae bacterium]|nr:RidA family protein [Phycisphaeraceae bacterium]